MNGLREGGVALAAALKERVVGGLACDVLVCPPFTLLHEVARVLRGSGIALGAQDCHEGEPGAHTGDIAAAMLKDTGCSFVIVGHSERRHGHGESDALVQRKAAAAHRAGLAAIVCVGETEAERDRGLAFDVIARQVERSLPEGAAAADTVIAYEPVWAIGSGVTPTPADIAELHGFIRGELGRLLGKAEIDALRILYGGSVKPANASELLLAQDVDGALVGGASLTASDFYAVLAAYAGRQRALLGPER
jgi:triosephosphate isomerase